MKATLQMVWYYHHPTISSDEEINDTLLTSLLPLLRAHAASARKVTIAITGVLVDRIAQVAPRALSSLRALIDEGLCEVAGTTYHEALPPFLPLRYLKLQIERDLVVKSLHLKCAPTTFHPTAFTWSGSLEHVLPDLGFTRLIIDEAHYVYATSTQLWRWKVGVDSELRTLLQPTLLDRRELHRPYRYSLGDNRVLVCFIRDVGLGRALSFGSTGAIHQSLDHRGLDELVVRVSKALQPNSCITLADDGDRINAVSLAAYERFLHALPEDVFSTFRDTSNDHAEKPLPYLPSFSIADLHRFWLSDFDSVQYLRILDEIYACDVPPELQDELLELQDVFFLFWKTVPRKHYYLEKALAIRKRVGEAGRAAN